MHYRPYKVNFSFNSKKDYVHCSSAACVNTGYTLVEMAIVLVIIGLLVGTVLAGAGLVRTMELKTIATEGNSYKVAIRSFADKYNALPGDMPNATSYWGAANASAAACAALTTESTSSATCNGNGDGDIAPATVTYAAGTEGHEAFRAWQHMHNAGLLNVRVSGVQGSGGSRHAVVGTNIPSSRFSNGAGWSLFFLPYSDTTSGNCTSISGNGGFAQKLCRLSADSNWIITQQEFGNVLLLGAAHGSQYAESPILSATDAYSMDSKFDDGLPGAGEIRAVGDYASSGNSAVDCFQMDDPNGAGYITSMGYVQQTTDDIGCSVMLRLPPRQ